MGQTSPQCPRTRFLIISARRLGRASVSGPEVLDNLITKSYQISYCLIKLTVTPPYPPHGGPPRLGHWGNFNQTYLNFLLLRLFWHLGGIHFFIVFSLPFLIDLGSIFPPNLNAKIHQNPQISSKNRCQDAFPC